MGEIQQEQSGKWEREGRTDQGITGLLSALGHTPRQPSTQDFAYSRPSPSRALRYQGRGVEGQEESLMLQKGSGGWDHKGVPGLGHGEMGKKHFAPIPVLCTSRVFAQLLQDEQIKAVHPQLPLPATQGTLGTWCRHPGHSQIMLGASIKFSRSSSSWCCAYLSRDRWCATDSTSCSTSMLRSFLHRLTSLTDSS